MIASTSLHPEPSSRGLENASDARLHEACNRLRAAGLRITQPRIAILGALIRRSLPASIEQIHADLAASTNASCDLVTVYRCLAAFEELGLVRRCFYHNGTSLYQIDLDDSPTYHVVDKTDNAVHALDTDLAEELREALRRIEGKLAERGFENVTHMVEFFGRHENTEAQQEQTQPKISAVS